MQKQASPAASPAALAHHERMMKNLKYLQPELNPSLAYHKQESLMTSLGFVPLYYSATLTVFGFNMGAHLHNPYGILHGGVSLALAEHAASSGSGLNLSYQQYIATEVQKKKNVQQKICVGQEVTGNHIRPTVKGSVVGIAKIVHAGETTHLWDVVVMNLESLDNVTDITLQELETLIKSDSHEMVVKKNQQLVQGKTGQDALPHNAKIICISRVTIAIRTMSKL